MANQCRFITNSYPSAFILKDFLEGLQRLSGDPNVLDTCDLDRFKMAFGLNFDTDAFVAKHNTGDEFQTVEASEDLFGMLLDLVKSGGQNISQGLEIFGDATPVWSLLDKSVAYAKAQDEMAEEEALKKRLDYFEKKIDLYESHLSDPVFQTLLTDEELLINLANIEELRELLKDKNLESLEESIERSNLAFQEGFQELSQLAQDRVAFWSGLDKLWNGWVRPLFPLAAGIATGGSAAPLAIMVAGASDSIGEKAAKASWQEDYTFKRAVGEVAYHLPFQLAKGLGFQAGPWVGGGIFTGVTFLETTGAPEAGNASIEERLANGGFQAAVAAAGMVGAALVSRFLFGVFNRFGSLPNRRLFAARPRPVVVNESQPAPVASSSPSPAETVTPPVALPPPPQPRGNPPSPEGARGGGSTNFVRGGGDASPNNRRHGPQPSSPSDRERLLARLGVTSPSAPVVQYSKSRISLAEETFGRIPDFAQRRLARLEERILMSLNAGVEPTALSNVKAVVYKGHRLCWEGRILGPSKPRVYFEIVGFNGQREMRVLGYSIGEKGQGDVLAAISKTLGHTSGR